MIWFNRQKEHYEFEKIYNALVKYTEIKMQIKYIYKYWIKY